MQYLWFIVDKKRQLMFIQIQKHTDRGTHFDATLTPLFVTATVHEPRPLFINIHTPSRLVFALNKIYNDQIKFETKAQDNVM